MSHTSPEIDCNHEWKEYEDKQGYTYRLCSLCNSKERLVANGPDDCEWEEIE